MMLRLLAIAHGMLAATKIGMKEHHRLVLAHTLMAREIEGRRTSSKLLELVMAKPLVSARMVAKTLEVTPQAARRIVLELGLREMTARGSGVGRGLEAGQAGGFESILIENNIAHVTALIP